jgi:integrase
MMRRSFRRILTKAELPIIRFHDLRHSEASLLLSLGVHAKIVQELLGHSQIGLTLDTYSHVLPSLQEEAVNRLNTLLSKRV